MKTVNIVKKINWVLASIMFFSSINAFAQTRKIYWNEGKELNWEDYSGKPMGEDFEKALTTCNIEVGYKAKLENEALKIILQVKAFFEPGKSWVKEMHKTEETLRHEKLYFDIAELFTRKLKKIFTETEFDQETYQAEIKKITKETLDEMWDFREKYGIETFFGSKNVEQAKWEEKVQFELDSLAQYAEIK